MNQWKQAFQALAPQGAQAGTSAQSVPFAPGMGNGDYKTPGSTSEMFSRLGQLQGLQGARQGMAQATAIPSGAPGSDQAPSAPPNATLQWTPEVQQTVLDYLMQMLKQTGKNYQMTTTGGVLTPPKGQGY